MIENLGKTIMATPLENPAPERKTSENGSNVSDNTDPEGISSETHLSSSTILLVDDTPLNLRILFEALGDAGFKLLVAESGNAALEQVARLKPDLILLDVMMPGINGFDTCRRLKADPETADIPVVFMTALSDTVDKIQGLSIGAVDYITKPIQPDEVLARVKTHLTVHHLRQQLQQQNEQLKQEIQERKQVEQSLRLLHRSVSHDLKNPVNGMIMVLNNLLKGIGTVPLEKLLSTPHTGERPALTEDNIVVPRKTLERMVKSSDRQLQLINSLLETPKAEPTVELERRPMNVSDLIDSLSQDIQPLLLQHPASLTYDIPKQLPLVNADPTQIWRVFENLITNAIKHNPPGVEVAIAIALSDSHANPSHSPSTHCMLRCEVRDNGTGISEDEQRTLFHPYQRGAEGKQTPGLGLGLYLCRQIIETHGGQIGVTSQPQQGTAFWFTVPCIESTCAEMG